MRLGQMLLGLFVVSLAACADEPLEVVATDIHESHRNGYGTVRFSVSEDVRRTRHDLGFELVAYVTASSGSAKLRCHAPNDFVEPARVVHKNSGNRWVKIGSSAEVSYQLTREGFSISVDDILQSTCQVPEGGEIHMRVLFDSEPRPMNWSGDGLLGFGFSVPEHVAPKSSR